MRFVVPETRERPEGKPPVLAEPIQKKTCADSLITVPVGRLALGLAENETKPSPLGGCVLGGRLISGNSQVSVPLVGSNANCAPANEESPGNTVDGSKRVGKLIVPSA